MMRHLLILHLLSLFLGCKPPLSGHAIIKEDGKWVPLVNGRERFLFNSSYQKWEQAAERLRNYDLWMQQAEGDMLP
jgi:hypothetical protein